MNGQLTHLIDRFAPVNGSHATGVAQLMLHRQSSPSELAPCFCEPSLCVIAQGAKQVLVGEDVHLYDVHKFLLVSAELPVTTRVVEASANQPYLSVSIRLDLAM